jgi:hypothetical protein
MSRARKEICWREGDRLRGRSTAQTVLKELIPHLIFLLYSKPDYVILFHDCIWFRCPNQVGPSLDCM